MGSHLRQRGRGSVARQKTVFHDHVGTHKHAIFNGGAEVLLDRLSAAAGAIGKAVNESLRELAEKVEVSISVLWEGMPNDHLGNVVTGSGEGVFGLLNGLSSPPCFLDFFSIAIGDF
ncbi:hypothetical protein BDR05DRAFT_995184 [Suillus weaverae]|nr:hypothetical protein BDR05DRAFT_995184 [Suillus weaverae]